MWHQVKICSAEGVAVAGGEVREGHLVGTADLRIDMVNLARKAVRRKPLGHCLGIDECPIDLLRCRTEHPVKPDGAGGHDDFSLRCASRSAGADEEDGLRPRAEEELQKYPRWCSDNPVDNVAILHEEDCRRCPDVVVGGEARSILNVDL